MLPVEEYLVITPLPDGRLMGVFDRTVDGVQEAAVRFSSDHGHTWSEAKTLFKLPKEPGAWGLHNMILDRNGEAHLIYTTYSTPKAKSLYEMRFDIWHVGSKNGRTEWEVPRLVREGYYGSMLSFIHLWSGRLLLPICYLTPRVWSHRGEGFDAFAYMGRFSSSVLYSDDGGKTWYQSPVEFKAPTPIIGADGMIEPAALQLKDGRIWLLIRTQLGRFFESFSKDGVEWSPPTATSILSSDSPAGLARLQDGRIVLLWNNCLRFSYANGGRHVLHAAISEDEGKTWRGYREVARHPLVDQPPPPTGDHGVSYTVPNVTAAGTVISPLSTGPGGGTYILHVDPEWLYETVQRTDFSSGLEGWSTHGTKGIEVIPHPDKAGAKVLQIRKTEADWPAGAVWNFPSGKKGCVRMKVLLRPRFGGVRIGLTDHFSVPFDMEEEYYNLYNLVIGPDGELPGGKRLQPNRWHDLQLDWDCDRRECRVSIDGQRAVMLPLTRLTAAGVNYLRLRSTAERVDNAGFLITDVIADVSRSWSRAKR